MIVTKGKKVWDTLFSVLLGLGAAFILYWIAVQLMVNSTEPGPLVAGLAIASIVVCLATLFGGVIRMLRVFRS